jgi:hypothetical protein
MEVSGQLHAPADLPQGESPLYPLDRRLGGSKNWSGHGNKKNPFIKINFVIVIIDDELSQTLDFTVYFTVITLYLHQFIINNTVRMELKIYLNPFLYQMQ